MLVVCRRGLLSDTFQSRTGTSEDSTESNGEGTARVQVGPGAAPKRLGDGGRASKTQTRVGSKESRADCATLKVVIGGVAAGRLIVLDSGGRASVVEPGLGAGAGERRVGECRAVCS